MSLFVFAVYVSLYVAPRHHKDPTVSLSNDSRACGSVWLLWLRIQCPRHPAAALKPFGAITGIKALLGLLSHVFHSIQAVSKQSKNSSLGRAARSPLLLQTGDWYQCHCPSWKRGFDYVWFHQFSKYCNYRFWPAITGCCLCTVNQDWRDS